MDYSRQIPLHLNIPKSANIVGCGGVGSWMALSLALSGVPELYLWDDDVIERTNLNRTLFEEKDIGRKKTEVVKEIIHRYRPYCKIREMGRLPKDGFDILSLAEIIVDCSDDASLQNLLAYHCKKQCKIYYRCGCDGEYMSIHRGLISFPTSLDNNTGYQWNTSFVGTVLATVGLTLVNILFPNTDIQIMASIKEIRDGTTLSPCRKCTRGDCENCDRGDCDRCDFVDPNDGWGYCDECDRPTIEEHEELRREILEVGRRV